MHSFKGSLGSIFHYNPDFSGNVTINNEVAGEGSIEIPARDLLQFVADCYVRTYKMDEIEQAPWTKLLQKGEHPQAR